MNILLCRLTLGQCNQIIANQNLPSARTHTVLSQRKLPLDDQTVPVYNDEPIESDPYPSRQYIETIFENHKIDVCIASQKLLWYSDILESICLRRGVDLFWCEPFFGNRHILDRRGLQYCRDCELDYANHPKIKREFSSVGPIDWPVKTREKQPDPDGSFSVKHGADPASDIVVFGQVPHDMALREYPGSLDYQGWLDALFRKNSNRRFYFKHHPIIPTEFDFDQFGNVDIIDAPISQLFAEMELFAAFSSTTIFEGMRYNRKFITGGWHFCRDLTYHWTGIEPFDLAEHPVDRAGFIRRARFICNAYTVDFSGDQLAARLQSSSDEFFLAS